MKLIDIIEVFHFVITTNNKHGLLIGSHFYCMAIAG